MYRFVSITHRHTQKKKLILKNYVGNWLVGKKRKKKRKMNEFVAYYKTSLLISGTIQKLKKKIKGEKRTKRRRIQLLTHTHKVIEEIDCTIKRFTH